MIEEDWPARKRVVLSDVSKSPVTGWSEQQLLRLPLVKMLIYLFSPCGDLRLHHSSNFVGVKLWLNWAMMTQATSAGTHYDEWRAPLDSPVTPGH